MAKIDFKGIEEYSKKLEVLFKDTEKVVREAVHQGAAIVADEIKAGIEGLPVEEGENGLPPVGTQERKLKGVSRRQKGDLINSFGLAPIENENGYVHTKAGVDGYGSIPTKKYPKGVPNAMLMRSIESGTTFREKNPIFRTATNRARKRCEKKMDETVDDKIKKIMEEKKNGN